MSFLPTPKQIVKKEGICVLNPTDKIIFGSREGSRAAKLLQTKLLHTIGFMPELSRPTRFGGKIFLELDEEMAEQAYTLSITPDTVRITAGSGAGLYYGAQTLIQHCQANGAALPCMEIADEPALKNRGIMLDATRGRVPSLESIKRLVDRLAAYKMNQLQIYIEHTFAYAGMEEVYRGASPLTAADILELDAYCRERYVELIPAFASFGHLYHLLASKTYSRCCELEPIADEKYSWLERQVHHVFNVSNPESIGVIEEMVSQTAPLFSSDKFNIGCDETFDLCKGRSAGLLQENTLGQVYVDFLQKICKAVRKYGKKTMFFSDILIHHQELIGQMPPDVISLTWGYDEQFPEENVRIIRDGNLPQYLCSGTSGWNRFVNDYALAWGNIRYLTKLGIQYGVEGMMNTDWGDLGNVNCLETSVPAFVYGLALAWNYTEESLEPEISAHVYGRGCDRVLPLLRELGGLQKFNWGDFAVWYEGKRGVRCREETVLKPWVDEEFAAKVSFDSLLQADKFCKEIEIGLKQMVHQVREELREDFFGLFLQAEAVRLFNALFAVIQVRDYGYDNPWIIEPWTLASCLEAWMRRYEQEWRRINRESELFRIREAVFYACDYLRNT